MGAAGMGATVCGATVCGAAASGPVACRTGLLAGTDPDATPLSTHSEPFHRRSPSMCCRSRTSSGSDRSDRDTSPERKSHRLHHALLMARALTPGFAPAPPTPTISFVTFRCKGLFPAFVCQVPGQPSPRPVSLPIWSSRPSPLRRSRCAPSLRSTAISATLPARAPRSRDSSGKRLSVTPGPFRSRP